MKKAIGYCRVSTQGQVDDGVSLEAQESKIRSWCELNGYELADICVDAGLSGKKAENRPGLQQALQAVADGDAICVYSLSRLARSTRDTLEISDYLTRRGADLVSLSERIDTTTAAGKMIFRMLAVLSEFERDQVSERTRCALQHIRSQGKKTGGDVPLGFNLNDVGELIENSEEQEIINLIKSLRAQGHSYRAIACNLEAHGFRTKRGNAVWHPQTIKQILRAAA